MGRRIALHIILALVVMTTALLLPDVAVADEVPAISKPPPWVVSHYMMFYPPVLRRLGVSGRVSLAYSVGLSGRPEKITVFVSDDSRLDAFAIDYLSHFRFEVPKTWSADGGPWRRFHFQFTFAFAGDPPRPNLVDDGEVITITAGLIKSHR